MNGNTDQVQQTRWSLEELFPAHDSPQIQEALSALDQTTDRTRTGALPPDRGHRKQMILWRSSRRWTTITDLAHRLYGFSGLWFTEDTQNQQALSFSARTEQTMAEMQNRVLFFTLWWKDLDDANAGRLLNVLGTVSLLAGIDAQIQATYLERA
jgi:oligoendopeptidase F